MITVIETRIKSHIGWELFDVPHSNVRSTSTSTFQMWQKWSNLYKGMSLNELTPFSKLLSLGECLPTYTKKPL